MSTRSIDEHSKEWIGMQEAADLLGVARCAVYRLEAVLAPAVLPLGTKRSTRRYRREVVLQVAAQRAELARVRAAAASAKRDVSALTTRKKLSK